MELNDPVALLSDQHWRLNHLYSIVDKDGIRVPFRLNWAQREFYAALHTNNIILKARQLGFSTLVHLLMLDTCLFNPDIQCGVIAHTDEAAKELFRRNIKQPLESLPPALRALNPVVSDATHQIRFANGSGIRVATTMRGGTLQLLHISEFGKICAQTPNRAREIVTGSLETVGHGNLVVIESTAEGTEGYFHDTCQTARALADAGKPLTSADFKFFFYPWWREPDYALTAPQPIDDSLREYFAELRTEHGIELTTAQQYWYAAKKSKLGDDIYREYPSTADEAFRTSLDGAYYRQQITRARREGRIGDYPPDPRHPFRVYTDLGISDDTCLIFEQCIQGQYRIFDFVENNGQPIQWYVNQIMDRVRAGLILDRLVLPHDARKRDLATGKSLEEVVLDLGLRPVEVLPISEVAAGIQAVRDRLLAVVFHEPRAAPLIKHLETYRRDWSPRAGAWSDKPRHDEHSHAADAFRYFAVTEQQAVPRRKTRNPISAILR